MHNQTGAAANSGQTTKKSSTSAVIPAKSTKSSQASLHDKQQIQLLTAENQQLKTTVKSLSSKIEEQQGTLKMLYAQLEKMN